MQILSPPIVTRCQCNKLRYSLNSFIRYGQQTGNSSRHCCGNSGTRKCQKARKPAPGLRCSGHLIKLSLADELGFKGKKGTITIAKVGGEEEELITTLFRVRIRSLVSRNVTHTVTAVGIPCISSDITEINLSHVAGIFGLGEEEIRRRNGPVDLLVGIDHPKLHTGETREADNLIARQSLLGWVIFGTTPGKRGQVNRVFSVKVPTPIDMTDFWTTETMGVAAKPCECEVDKLSAVNEKN